MNKLQKILLGIFFIVITAAGYGFYLLTKKPADVRKLSANYELTASKIVADYNTDENKANSLYLDKVVAVKGNITEVKIDPTGQATVFLDSGDPMAAVTCSFYDEEATAAKTLKKGNEVIIKGKCTGKLMDVVLNKCSIAK